MAPDTSTCSTYTRPAKIHPNAKRPNRKEKEVALRSPTHPTKPSSSWRHAVIISGRNRLGMALLPLLPRSRKPDLLHFLMLAYQLESWADQYSSMDELYVESVAP